MRRLCQNLRGARLRRESEESWPLRFKKERAFQLSANGGWPSGTWESVLAPGPCQDVPRLHLETDNVDPNQGTSRNSLARADKKVVATALACEPTLQKNKCEPRLKQNTANGVSHLSGALTRLPTEFPHAVKHFVSSGSIQAYLHYLSRVWQPSIASARRADVTLQMFTSSLPSPYINCRKSEVSLLRHTSMDGVVCDLWDEAGEVAIWFYMRVHAGILACHLQWRRMLPSSCSRSFAGWDPVQKEREVATCARALRQ